MVEENIQSYCISVVLAGHQVGSGHLDLGNDDLVVLGLHAGKACQIVRERVDSLRCVFIIVSLSVVCRPPVPDLVGINMQLIKVAKAF